MTTTLIILSALCIAAYTAAVCIKQKRIPASISATFYKLEHKFWFGATIWTTALLFMPAILEITEEKHRFIAFLMCAGLMFVGAAPNFKEGLENKVHSIGCCISVIFAEIFIGIYNPLLFILWSLFLIYISVKIKSRLNDDSIKNAFMSANPMFFIEIVVFAQIYLCYFLQ